MNEAEQDKQQGAWTGKSQFDYHSLFSRQRLQVGRIRDASLRRDSGWRSALCPENGAEGSFSTV